MNKNSEMETRREQSLPYLDILAAVAGTYIGAQLFVRLLLLPCGYDPIRLLREERAPDRRTTTVRLLNQYLLPRSTTLVYEEGKLREADNGQVRVLDRDGDGSPEELYNGDGRKLNSEDIVLSALEDRAMRSPGEATRLLEAGMHAWASGERLGERLGLIQADRR